MDPPPLKNHKNYKATKPAFNVGPSSARQRNAFRWRADDDPLIMIFGSTKNLSKMDPLTKLSGFAHVLSV